MASLSLNQFDEKLAALLDRDGYKEYLFDDILFNGLQVRGKNKISRVGFGVSSSLKLFKLAKKEKCDMVVVHHGIVIAAPMLDRVNYERFVYMVKNNISLWSAHFILDAHRQYGNNAQILKTIGAKRTKPFFHGAAPWGWYGEFSTPKTLDEIIGSLDGMLSPDTIVYDYGNKEIKRVVCVSGKGGPTSSDVAQLINEGVDLYITGEAHEWHREICREEKMNFVAGGHYHTEMFGVKALQEVIGKKWGLKTVWLGVENTV